MPLFKKFKKQPMIRVSKAFYRYVNNIDLSPLTLIKNREVGMRFQMIRPDPKKHYIVFKIGRSDILLTLEHLEAIYQEKILHRCDAADYRFVEDVEDEIIEINFYAYSI